MSNDFDDPSDSDSDSPEITEMRRIIAEYESCEDPWLKSEWLESRGWTRAIIMSYQQRIARADSRSSSIPSATRRARAPRRSRVRRMQVAPSSRAYDTTRPGDSLRNRRVRNGVTVFIIVRIYRSPDAP